MKIVDLETLNTLPIGTVFCKVDQYYERYGDMYIISDKSESGQFSDTLLIYPNLADDDVDIMYYMHRHPEYLNTYNFPSTWESTKKPYIRYDFGKDQLFVVYTKKEIEKMIKLLQFALSDGKDEFDQSEIIAE